MQPTPFPVIHAIPKGLSVRGYTVMQIRAKPQLLKTAVQYVYDRLQDGRFRPKIARTFPLDQVVDAYKFLESNAQVGKIVITV